MNKLKVGDIVKIREWKCVILNITKKAYRRLMNGRIGLNGFRGFWYGNDPKNISCYGKIIEFDKNESVEIIDNLDNFLKTKSIEDLKNLID